MPVINSLNSGDIERLNYEIQQRETAYDNIEKENCPRKTDRTADEFIDYMNRGIERIANSPSVQNLFGCAQRD